MLSIRATAFPGNNSRNRGILSSLKIQRIVSPRDKRRVENTRLFRSATLQLLLLILFCLPSVSPLLRCSGSATSRSIYRGRTQQHSRVQRLKSDWNLQLAIGNLGIDVLPDGTSNSNGKPRRISRRFVPYTKWKYNRDLRELATLLSLNPLIAVLRLSGAAGPTDLSF